MLSSPFAADSASYDVTTGGAAGVADRAAVVVSGGTTDGRAAGGVAGRVCADPTRTSPPAGVTGDGGNAAAPSSPSPPVVAPAAGGRLAELGCPVSRSNVTAASASTTIR